MSEFFRVRIRRTNRPAEPLSLTCRNRPEEEGAFRTQALDISQFNEPNTQGNTKRHTLGMARYAPIITAALAFDRRVEMTRAQDVDCEYAFDAFYSSYLDSLSYYMPDSVIKFFINASPTPGHAAGQDRYGAQECQFMQETSTSYVLLLLAFLVLMLLLSIGVLILIMRSILHEKIGRMETKQLIHREQSGFGLGLGISWCDNTGAVEGNENNEEELDATPGHLHAVNKTKEIALISNAEGKKRCFAQHSPSTSPLPFIEDILLDKSGLEDVPCPPSPEIQKEKLMSVETLNTVPERMCEDSLDDTHAFCDVPYEKVVQRKSLSSINECSDKLEKSTSNGPNSDVSTRAQ